MAGKGHTEQVHGQGDRGHGNHAGSNPDANPVEFLLGIMRCPDLQLPTRMKAAKDVLPYVSPSLQSIAHTGDKDSPSFT